MLGFTGPDYDLPPYPDPIARHDSRDGLAYRSNAGYDEDDAPGPRTPGECLCRAPRFIISKGNS
jgi:hypothetical protein